MLMSHSWGSLGRTERVGRAGGRTAQIRLKDGRVFRVNEENWLSGKRDQRVKSPEGTRAWLL